MWQVRVLVCRNLYAIETYRDRQLALEYAMDAVAFGGEVEIYEYRLGKWIERMRF